ncbi:hypothetical protein ACGF0J_16025 [Nonomuraea sp. NPDC047897]|uniref:hypothetical protein n=1 Tax=Nonomuraea sp. NPDC047897 TaxID=3364346 RepID=UPI00371260BF
MASSVPRAALFAVVPAELLITVSILSGTSTPAQAEMLAAVIVAPFTVWESLIGCQLFTQARSAGAGRWAALRSAAGDLLPLQLRMILGAESKGLSSLALWARRRRDGVPRGGVALSYAKEQASVVRVLFLVLVVEMVAVELMMAASQTPAGLRAVVLAADLYGLVFALSLGAACVTRPHVVTTSELRIRYGAYLDVRIPRELVASVRLRRDYPSGVVTVADDRLTVAVSSQTNLVVELTRPITVTRPLGRRARVTAIRFFAEDPNTALRHLAT